MSKPQEIHFDVNAVAAYTLERNREFIENSEQSPEQFVALMQKHEAGQCGGQCGFCKIDQDAAAFVIADNAARAMGRIAVPFHHVFPARTVH